MSDASPQPAGIGRSYLKWGCLAILLFYLSAAIWLPLTQQSSYGRARIASCAHNLRQLAIAFASYADSNRDELYPPLSSELGRLSFVVQSVYPETIWDPFVHLCPASDHRPDFNDGDELTPEILHQFFNDANYFYLGYVVVSDDGMEDFAQAYRDAFERNASLETDIELPDGRGVETAGYLWRLRIGIERVLFTIASADAIETAQARIPIFIERSDNHPRAGGNVVYMDGHVEFIEYPGKWPMTEKTVRILNELDALGARTSVP